MEHAAVKVPACVSRLAKQPLQVVNVHGTKLAKPGARPVNLGS